MKQIIGFCGYRCDLCPVHKSNYKNIDKKKIRDGWAKYFNYNTEIVGKCEGCLNDGNPKCEVKPCAKEKGIEHCGRCPDFGCNKLKSVMNVVENNIKDLSCVSEEDYNLFIKPYLAKERLLKIRNFKV